ncbi:MAG: acyltransferase domain-containing protein [Microbacteriaceae bacterium]|nr:acyltransferase domain-containing protein [Burkholderiaceae bacterium]
MSLALLFPGQGVQHAAMLPWLDAEPLAAPMLKAMALGDDWRARLADEDWASSNRIAQPLMTGVALAAWAVLAPRLSKPAMVAGYSVGELAAFSVAGLFSADEALQLAQQRAALMDHCAGTEPGGLLAVSGVGVASLGEQLVRFGLAVAIRLGIDRCVLGGTLAALAAITPELLARGADLTPLKVRLPSHTAAMGPAALDFAALLAPLNWPGNAQAVVVCNLDGAGRRESQALKQALARQIDHTVEWERCMTTLAERRPRCVLEVGPGTSLARMWAARFPEVPVRSVDEFQSAQAVAAWVERTLGEQR